MEELKKVSGKYLEYKGKPLVREGETVEEAKARIKKEQEKRDYYVKECVDCAWSVRQLERQINSFYYEKNLYIFRSSHFGYSQFCC